MWKCVINLDRKHRTAAAASVNDRKNISATCRSALFYVSDSSIHEQAKNPKIAAQKKLDNLCARLVIFKITLFSIAVFLETSS